jgi:hypothetical protein
MATKSVIASVVACFLLSFSGLALAGSEQRCVELGSNCVCGEPLNTATHDGGSAIWSTSGGQYFNPDDSPSGTQCFPGNGNGKPGQPWNTEIYCSAMTFTPVPASSEAGKLPSGHSLSYVIHHAGDGGICHVSHPRIEEAVDVTYCIRSYRRYDATSYVPQNSLEQQKIQTIGGNIPNTNDVLNAQLSVDVNGDIHTRFDGNLFNAPIDFQSLGNIVTDCTNNYCRFETCWDYSAIGEGRVRFRRTNVPPGSGSAIVFKPVGSILRPSGLSLDGPGPNGISLYSQGPSGSLYNSYNTHFIVTRVRPEDRSFWPGPACEVEGGCSGAVVPGSPASVTVR